MVGFYKNSKCAALHLLGIWILHTEERLVSEGLFFPLMWIASGLFRTSPDPGFLPEGSRGLPYGLGCFQIVMPFPSAEEKVGVACHCASLQGTLGVKTERQRSSRRDARVGHGAPVTLSRLCLLGPIAEQFWPRIVLTERASESV